MNDEKREALLFQAAEAYFINRTVSDRDGRMIFHGQPYPVIAADFALEQMRPLEERIADTERRLRIAVEALEQIANVDWHGLYPDRRVITEKALAQIRGEEDVKG